MHLRIHKGNNTKACRCDLFFFGRQACGKLQASAVASCQGLAPKGNVSVESGARRVVRKLRVEKVVMDRIGKPAIENFTSAVYLQARGGCNF